MVLLSAPANKLFRQRCCKADNCGRLFFICPHCYRGQRYCSESCRLKSRAEQLRTAQRRYLQSPEGRKDQSERQRAYRQRKAVLSSASASKSVIDQSPPIHLTSGMITFLFLRPLLRSDRRDERTAIMTKLRLRGLKRSL